MADALASWTSSMSARLLSSTGETSEHAESSAHEDVCVCCLCTTSSIVSTWSVYIRLFICIGVYGVLRTDYKATYSAAQSCTATTVLLPNFSSVLPSCDARPSEVGTSACKAFSEHVPQSKRGEGTSWGWRDARSRSGHILSNSSTSRSET